jgi:DNA polymerase (family 10)
MDNERIARAFEELASLLELQGEGPFKLRAYRSFADSVRELGEPVTAIVERGALVDMPGVGKAIAAKVDDLLKTGTFSALERARAAVPPTLLEVLRVPGLGPKSVRSLWQEAGVTTLGELLYACEENRLAKLPTFGVKKQAKTLEAVRKRLEKSGAMLLAGALEATDRVRRALYKAGLRDVEPAGAARRGVEIVRDLLVLVKGADAARIETALAAAKEDMECGDVARDGDDVLVTFGVGERARVRGVRDAAWVASLMTETGSDAHVRWLEGRAAPVGGLAAIAARAKREEDVYAALDLPYAPPELREGPTLSVPPRLDRVHGVFHVHTDWSDGTASIVDMAREAARTGFTYIGITDHTQAASYANGLDSTRLVEQARAIAIARRELPQITILHGTEVDILADGSLDLDDATLGALDFVIASVHTRFAMPPDEMTARIVRAVSHPLVTILGHPTGRLLLGRGGYTFDVEKVARAAAANDTYLEINANPQRLDLSDELARRAAAAGAQFAIDPDAHSLRGLSDTPLGLIVARRAGLSSAQILNARDRSDLVATLAARKKRALAELTG